MTHHELTQTLRFMCPNDPFSVWDISNPVDPDKPHTYHGENPNPPERFGFLVDWRGKDECPSEADILAVEQDKVFMMLEDERKANRNRVLSEDHSLVYGYKTERKNRPDLSWSDFLDEVETTSNELQEQEDK